MHQRVASVVRIDGGWKVVCRSGSEWVADLFVYDDSFFCKFVAFSVSLGIVDLWVDWGIQQPVLI